MKETTDCQVVLYYSRGVWLKNSQMLIHASVLEKLFFVSDVKFDTRASK